MGQKNSFWQALGWQPMRPRVCLQTFSNATVAFIPTQPSYFIGALEIPSQPLLSIVSVITKDQHWPSCLFLIPTQHWSASLPPLGPATWKALTNQIPRPLFINMILMAIKLPLVLSLLPKQFTTKKVLVLSLAEMNSESTSWKTIKPLCWEVTMELTALTMAKNNSTRMWKKSKFGK